MINWEFDRNTLITKFGNEFVSKVERDDTSHSQDGTRAGQVTLWGPVPPIAAWEQSIYDNFKKFQEELNLRGVLFEGILTTFKCDTPHGFKHVNTYRICKEALQLLRLRAVANQVHQFVDYRKAFPRDVEDFFIHFI